MSTRTRLLIISAVLVLPAVLHAGQPPRSGWRKVSLNYLFAQPNASAAASIAAEVPIDGLEDYDSVSTVSVPTDWIERLRAVAGRLGIQAIDHDEYDSIETAAGAIDTRLPIAIPRGGRAAASYSADEFGLYIAQFKAPPKPGWLTAATAAGAILVRPVIRNGELIGATPSIATRIAALPFVQWLEPLHPYLKASPYLVGALYDIEFARLPGSSAARERARNLVTPGTDRSESYHVPGVHVVGGLSAEAVEQLLTEPTVIGIYDIGEGQISDERQAMSMTTNVITQSGNDVPISPGTYKTWLSGRCVPCGRLYLDGFKVDVADTGFYEGVASNLHPDFSAARLTYASNFVGADSLAFEWPTGSGDFMRRSCTGTVPCDINYHGTFVTGVVAGDGTGTGVTDSGGFQMGTGIAPSAGVVITKQSRGDTQAQVQTSTIFDWAADALGNGAFIQNLSQNDSRQAFYSGAYTSLSPLYDKVVRGIGSDGYARTPVMLTVPSGNVNMNGYFKTWPPGNAKNVISVGGSENVRDSSEWRAGGFPAEMPRANTFRNIWRFSCHSSNVQSGTEPWNKYIKPDVVAPVTQMAGPMTPEFNLPATPITQFESTQSAEQHFGYNNQRTYGFFVPNSNPQQYSRNYLINSGTSFAAPAGAGAALIASRIYSATPGAAKPALIKAMLTATARSLNGGLNYSVNGATLAPFPDPVPIGPAPDDVQGFGRIDLTDITDSSLSKSYVNQDVPPLTAGQKWVKTYAVTDASKPVKISLAWSDLAATDTSTNPFTLLVNDLDLQVYVGNGTTCQAYYGNNIEVRAGSTRGEESTLYTCNGNVDRKNNVEKVVFNPAVDGITRFSVIVWGTGITARATPCPAEPCPTTPEQDFALYVQNATELPQLPAPTLTSATGSSASVAVTWTPVQSAAKYQVWRGAGNADPQLVYTAENTLTYTDTAVSTGFYRYLIKAVDSGGGAISPYSNAEYAWVGTFTDDPLVVGESIVKAAHVLELRDRVNELRGFGSLSNFNYTNALTVGSLIKAADIVELRTALDQARSALGLSTLSYTYSITAGETTIRAVDIREIRDGLR